MHLLNLASPLWIQKTNPKSLYTKAQKWAISGSHLWFPSQILQWLTFLVRLPAWHICVCSFPLRCLWHPACAFTSWLLRVFQSITLQQKWLFRGRSAGVTLPLQRHSPGKGIPLIPHPPLTGGPTTACLCQRARALGHRPLLGSLHPLTHSLHPRVTPLPLSTVPPTVSR